MKVAELRKNAEAIEKFMKFPKTIQHPKLGYKYKVEEPVWLVPVTCRLRIDVVEGSDYTMHQNNTGAYRIAYVIESYDGEEQALPFGEDEMKEMIEHKTIMFSGGLYGNDLGKLIDRMYNWLKTKGYVKES